MKFKKSISLYVRPKNRSLIMDQIPKPKISKIVMQKKYQWPIGFYKDVVINQRKVMYFHSAQPLGQAESWY